uniref:Centrosomal protein of 44 kDa n=1 Tax=Stegastes partitus TaxID=144197 RepID=A0A3B4Z2D0_9TELE
MLSTGDVQGCLRKLETLLRLIKYPGHVDYDGLSKGDPSAFLPIVSFTLNSFSPLFAEELMASGLELTGKTDLRFTDALYKVALRDIFHYKPVLTKQQFLQWGFSQRKISVLCDIINLVMQKHSQLKKVLMVPSGYQYVERLQGSPAATIKLRDINNPQNRDMYVEPLPAGLPGFSEGCVSGGGRGDVDVQRIPDNGSRNVYLNHGLVE